MDRPPAAARPGPLLAGRYQLGHQLGAGGMARVVAGRDLVLDRAVAVKLLPAGGVDETVRERFRREARSVASFSHPNVVAAYDAGDDGGRLYLVMELVVGRSLAEVLAADGPMGIADATRVASAVLAALAAAHGVGIVHRDVKPGNVLLGDDGTVKLADFGIAHRLDELAADLTAAGTFIGTATYAAPELVAGRPATAACDLYAVGVVLYEMLAGRPPYVGDTPLAVALAQQQAPVPDLRVVRPDASPGLASAIGRAMAKDPARRFPSATAMSAALATPAPVAAPAATVTYPVGAVSRQRRRATAWWWVLTAALVALGVGVILLARRSDEAADGAATTASTAAATSAVPATTAAATQPAIPAATTAVATTAVATTAEPTAVAPAPTSVAALRALLDTSPDLWGRRTADVRHALDKVDGPGKDGAKQAARLLEQADTWVEHGELAASAVPVLRDVLGPLADDEGDEG